MANPKWSNTEIRAIVLTSPHAEHSIERGTYLQQELVVQCGFLVNERMVSYRTRFILDNNLTDFASDAASHIANGDYLKLTEHRFLPRRGRREQECQVRKFIKSGPGWHWLTIETELDRDLAFLMGSTASLFLDESDALSLA